LRTHFDPDSDPDFTGSGPFACGAAGTPPPYPLRAFPDPLRQRLSAFSFQLSAFLFGGTPLPYRVLRARINPR